MTTPTVCLTRCSLHTKRAIHLPCKACHASHVQLTRSVDEHAINPRNPRRQSRELDSRQAREKAPHLTTNGTRAASKGSGPDRLSSGTSPLALRLEGRPRLPLVARGLGTATRPSSQSATRRST